MTSMIMAQLKPDFKVLGLKSNEILKLISCYLIQIPKLITYNSTDFNANVLQLKSGFKCYDLQLN